MHPSPPSLPSRRSWLALGSFVVSLITVLMLMYVVTIGYLTYAFHVLSDSSAISIAIFPIYLGIYLCVLFCVGLGTAALDEIKLRHGNLRGRAWAISGITIGSIALLLTLILTLFHLPALI